MANEENLKPPFRSGSEARENGKKGGMQALSFIPECDLYRLITHSSLPCRCRFGICGVYLVFARFCGYFTRVA